MRSVEKNGVVRRLLSDVVIPPMALIQQNFPRPQAGDVSACVRNLMMSENCAPSIRTGMRIAVTCGSRGIANIREIIRETCRCVRALGAFPFIVPAMGSHGGATAAGQRQIIESYGVTEAYCGAEILSDMAVVRIGQTEDGRDVFIDSHAARADGIILVNRVKPHTDFRGPYESGLMKMMVIGLGKQHGAEAFHADGPQHMARNLPLFGKAILQNANILFGLAVLENAYEETARIEAVPADRIVDREPLLLDEARELMPRSYIQDADLLIVDQVGKDISGDGMDPNITGRFCNPYVSGGMNVKKIAVLDLSEGSHGQMVGVGYGDTTTQRCFEKCDLEASYPNALTSTTFSPFRIPLILPSDREAIGACLKYCGGCDGDHLRVIRIHDTLHMSRIWVSEALLPEVERHPCLEVISAPEEMLFNEDGNLW